MAIALPSAQAALDIVDADKQWVITAYTVTFGGLVLLGGRVADYVGRKPAFLGGLLGFAVASAAAGAAITPGMLMGARAAQGAFAALLAPTASSLLAVTFTEMRERARAFAAYGTIAASGGAAGLIFGGLLTDCLSWRWCLYANVPIAVLAAVGAALVLPSNEFLNARHCLDVAGTVLATSGLVTLVYACTQVVSTGWGSPLVIGTLTGAAALLGAFTWLESRVASPLLPLRLLSERKPRGRVPGRRSGRGRHAWDVSVPDLLPAAGAGLHPDSGGPGVPTAVGRGTVQRQRARRPCAAPRPTPRTDCAGATGDRGGHGDPDPPDGQQRLRQPRVARGGFAGFGVGCVFVPAISTATRQVAQRDAGVAAAVVNAAQQVGGSIGTALLNSIAAGATATYLTTRPDTPEIATEALVHGFSHAAAWGAGILAAAAILVAALISSR